MSARRRLVAQARGWGQRSLNSIRRALVADRRGAALVADIFTDIAGQTARYAFRLADERLALTPAFKQRRKAGDDRQKGGRA